AGAQTARARAGGRCPRRRTPARTAPAVARLAHPTAARTCLCNAPGLWPSQEVLVMPTIDQRKIAGPGPARPLRMADPPSAGPSSRARAGRKKSKEQEMKRTLIMDATSAGRGLRVLVTAAMQVAVLAGTAV